MMKILSVTTADGTEFLCEQTVEKDADFRGETYDKTVRSKWLSRDGQELNDDVAMKLYRDKNIQNEKNELIKRLWSK